MSAYRFCRTDDIGLLVEAYATCYRAQVPSAPPLDAAAFKLGMRHINLWASSCMLAFAGAEPIAVVLAAKREHENWLHSLGVHPDHQRQGHGRHLLDSLSQKMAILGPPRLLAEVPAEWTRARRFFAACGYREETSFVDFERPPSATGAAASDAIVPVSLDDLITSGALAESGGRCWERAAQTLRNRRAEIAGVALAAAAVEAYVLCDRAAPPGGVEVLAFGCRRPQQSESLLGALFAYLGRERPLRIRRVSPSELDFSVLARLGFERGAETIGYAADAAA